MTEQSISFDRAASYYDATRGFPPDVVPQVARLFERVGRLTAHSRVLEPGVGTGRIALPIIRQTGAHYTGVDIALQMLRTLDSQRDGAPLTLIRGDATVLPLPPHTFDAAVITHVFHLIPNWQDALNEIRRVLKPGGVLLYSWTEYDAQDFFRVWQQAITSRTASPFGKFRGTAFLDEAGWRAVDPPGEVTYYIERTPAAYIDTLRNRIWSSTWRMSDAEIADGVRLLEQAAHERGLPLDAPIQQQVWFRVASYSPAR